MWTSVELPGIPGLVGAETDNQPSLTCSLSITESIVLRFDLEPAVENGKGDLAGVYIDEIQATEHDRRILDHLVGHHSDELLAGTSDQPWSVADGRVWELARLETLRQVPRSGHPSDELLHERAEELARSLADDGYGRPHVRPRDFTIRSSNGGANRNASLAPVIWSDIPPGVRPAGETFTSAFFNDGETIVYEPGVEIDDTTPNILFARGFDESDRVIAHIPLRPSSERSYSASSSESPQRWQLVDSFARPKRGAEEVRGLAALQAQLVGFAETLAAQINGRNEQS